MDNQHKKIKGYRDLSQADIDLMNRLKVAGTYFAELIADVELHINGQYNVAGATEDREELERLMKADPFTWLIDGRKDVQVAIMKLVRSVAQPTTF